MKTMLIVSSVLVYLVYGVDAACTSKPYPVGHLNFRDICHDDAECISRRCQSDMCMDRWDFSPFGSNYVECYICNLNLEPANSGCKSNDDCDSAMCDVDLNICMESKPDGETCSSNYNCKSLYCNDGICASLSLNGALCASGSDCISGMCNAYSNTCTSANVGADCAQDSECMSDMCRLNKCQDMIPTGQKCWRFWGVKCQSGYCDWATQICSLKPDGQICTDGSYCQSGYCKAYKCAPYKNLLNGEICTDSNDCVNICVRGICRRNDSSCLSQNGEQCFDGSCSLPNKNVKCLSCAEYGGVLCVDGSCNLPGDAPSCASCEAFGGQTCIDGSCALPSNGVKCLSCEQYGGVRCYNNGTCSFNKEEPCLSCDQYGGRWCAISGNQYYKCAQEDQSCQECSSTDDCEANDWGTYCSSDNVCLPKLDDGECGCSRADQCMRGWYGVCDGYGCCAARYY